MVDTIRQKIISAVLTGLTSIRTAAGYQTNMGGRVELVRSAIDAKHLPAVVVWPRPETGAKVLGKNKISMSIRFEGIVALGSDENAAEVGEMILGDIRTRVESLTEDISGGYADHVEYASGGVENYPEPGDTAVNCAAVYNIVYKTKVGNPYAQ